MRQALLALPALALLGFVPAGTASSDCCAALQAALPSQVFTNGTTTYQLFLQSYWAQQEQSLEPRCLVQPKSTNDVSVAVKILNNCNGGTGCKFAIKSGGHAVSPGAANIDSGVTIDLSLLNEVKINAAKKTASIGPGGRWGQVYSTLEAAGYTVPGGRDSTVGVGGLVLGGGISFLSPRVGFVCDAATNFEVVLASGAVINANTNQHQDLFRYLKGGSNNFGIVTKIDLPLVDAKMWGGFLYTDISLRTQIFDFLVGFATAKNYDEHASMIDSQVYINGSWLLAVQMTYTTNTTTSPAIFGPVLQLPGQTTVRPTTHFNLTSELGAADPVSPRALWITATFKNDAALMETIFQLGNATVASVQDTPGLFMALSFQPVPQVMIQKAKVNGGDALGLDEKDGDLAVWNVALWWQNEADDAKMYEAARKLLQDAKAQAKKNDLLNEYTYLNYALRYGKFTQDVIASYGVASQKAMRQVSKKYDPTGLFQRAVPGGFKL
jgi:hypothetical protein